MPPDGHMDDPSTPRKKARAASASSQTPPCISTQTASLMDACTGTMTHDADQQGPQLVLSRHKPVQRFGSFSFGSPEPKQHEPRRAQSAPGASGLSLPTYPGSVSYCTDGNTYTDVDATSLAAPPINGIMFSQAATCEQGVVEAKAKYSKAFNAKAAAARVAKASMKRSRAKGALLGSIAARCITLEQREDQSAEERYEQIIALQCQSCLNEGVDIRALFEKVMSKYESGNGRAAECSLPPCSAVASVVVKAEGEQRLSSWLTSDVRAADRRSSLRAIPGTDRRSSWIPELLGGGLHYAAHSSVEYDVSTAAASMPASILPPALIPLALSTPAAWTTRQRPSLVLNDADLDIIEDVFGEDVFDDILCVPRSRPSLQLPLPNMAASMPPAASTMPVAVAADCRPADNTDELDLIGLMDFPEYGSVNSLPANRSQARLQPQQMSTILTSSNGTPACASNSIVPRFLPAQYGHAVSHDMHTPQPPVPASAPTRSHMLWHHPAGPKPSCSCSGNLEMATSANLTVNMDEQWHSAPNATPLEHRSMPSFNCQPASQLTAYPASPGPQHFARQLPTAQSHAAPVTQPSPACHNVTAMQQAVPDRQHSRDASNSTAIVLDVKSEVDTAGFQGMDKRAITRQMLEEVYHLPINVAAQSLHMGVTVLKKYCRQFDVGRWPFRKLASIDKLTETIKQECQDNPEKALTAASLLHELEQCRAQIYRDPLHEIPDTIKRLRQANFKNLYKTRHANRQSKPGGSDNEEDDDAC